MKEDWTEQLRRKLEGHEMSPPEGLWEDISEQMGLATKPAKKQPVIIRFWWAAAAAVLALVGFFAFYHSDNNDAPLQTTDVPQHQTIAMTPPRHSDTPVTSIPQEETQEVASIEEQQPMEAEQQPMEEELHDELVEQENKKGEDQREDQRDRTLIQPVPQNQTTNPFDFPDSPKAPTSQKKWSVGINASGGLLAANTSQRVDRLYYKSADFHFGGSNYNYAEIVASSYSLTEYESKHHLPLRFGLSLQYQLNDRLSLLSGINYTYLYSEFSIPLYQSANYDQKLHYLGLPIGLSWRLLTASRFHLYLAGGMMLEKCLNEKPWQWSVNGSAGAEYAITSLLGVYLEPSLGYYFSDGTQFEHYYKEHPLAPSIEFGLRLHVGE